MDVLPFSILCNIAVSGPASRVFGSPPMLHWFLPPTPVPHLVKHGALGSPPVLHRVLGIRRSTPPPSNNREGIQGPMLHNVRNRTLKNSSGNMF